MIEGLVDRIEAVGQPVAGHATVVIGRIAVGEPVRHHEVDGLVDGGTGRIADERLVAGLDVVAEVTSAFDGDREGVGRRVE